MKACQDVCVSAAIALKLSKSSIRCVDNLWSKDKIDIIISPTPQVMIREALEEIIIRSFDAYLKRPGHVSLPGGMIPGVEFERERQNPLLRVRMLWGYWHGSQTLNYKQTRVVSAFITIFLII
jgi:hypothetical protein